MSFKEKTRCVNVGIAFLENGIIDLFLIIIINLNRELMKRRFLYLFALICSVSLFTACSDDEPGNTGPDFTLLQDATVGTYDGGLKVSMNGVDLTPEAISQRIFVKGEGADKVELSLKDFSFLDFSVGDIVVSGISLSGDASQVVLQETETTMDHDDLGHLIIKVSGTVSGEKANLNIAVLQKGGSVEGGPVEDMNIAVSFEGTRISKEVDDKDYSATIVGFYPRSETGFTCDYKEDGFALEYPADGITLTSAGYNKVAISKFYISFPLNPDLNAPSYIKAHQQIGVTSARLIKNVDGTFSIEETKGTVADKNKEEVEYTISGAWADKVLSLKIMVKSATYTINYAYISGTLQKTGKELLKMTFDSNIVTVQPEISDSKVVFYVDPDATDEQLKQLVPTFEVSEGATVLYNDEVYVKGTPIDFSGAKTTIKVKPEKGTTKTYTITHDIIDEFSFKVNFDAPWELKNETTNESYKYQEYYEPGNGWVTSNEGLKYVKSMSTGTDVYYPLDAAYLVTSTDKAVSGNAARLETADTKGAFVILTSIPKVTSATVYNGVFKVDVFNTLQSTHFGNICRKEPKSFKGYYKYTAGKDYYQAKYPGDPKKAHEVELDNSQKDAPALNAVLYEVDSYSTDHLNGTNLLTSNKVVAVASVEDAGEQADYTAFNVNFTYKSGKSWDASKKYKLAVVCSSSKDGDKFSGAPGSVLYIDELEVVF